MMDDLATEVIGRVRRLLDGLSSTIFSRQLSVPSSLGQRLCARYFDSLDRIFSSLYLPPTSAPLPGRDSDFCLLPLSYAWFDTRWINSLRRSRLFRRRPAKRKDEGIPELPFTGYISEDEAAGGSAAQSQSARSGPVRDVMLRAPEPIPLSAANMGFTLLEQLAKKYAPDFSVADVAYHPKPPADYVSLFHRSGEMLSGRSQHYSQAISDRTGTAATSQPGLYRVPRQPAGTALRQAPRELPRVVTAATQDASPVVLSRGEMDPGSARSATLPAIPGDRYADVAHKPFIPHALDSPPTAPGSIAATEASPRFSDLLGSRTVASSIRLRGRAPAVSHPYLLRPLRAASGGAVADEDDAIPVSSPREPSLISRDETADTYNATRQPFQPPAPQQPLEDAWQSSQMSLYLHRLHGQIRPSMTDEVLNGGPDKHTSDIASMVKSSLSNDHSGAIGLELSLAPIGRSREGTAAAVRRSAEPGQERALPTPMENTQACDPELLAWEVYAILKRRLRVEKERISAIVS